MLPIRETMRGKLSFEERKMRELERIIAKRPEIAYHEAAHALYAYIYPLEECFGVDSVSIVPVVGQRFGVAATGYDTLGWNQIVRRPKTERLLNNRELAEHWLVLALVGPAAEYFCRGRSRWGQCRELDGDHIRLHLFDCYGESCPTEFAGWLKARASLFVETTFPAIHAIAQELEAKKILTGMEVEAIWAEHKCPLIPERMIQRNEPE